MCYIIITERKADSKKGETKMKMEVYDRKKYKHAYMSLDCSGMTEPVAGAYRHLVTTYFIIEKHSLEDARKYCLELLEYYYEQNFITGEALRERVRSEIMSGEFKACTFWFDM